MSIIKLYCLIWITVIPRAKSSSIDKVSKLTELEVIATVRNFSTKNFFETIRLEGATFYTYRKLFAYSELSLVLSVTECRSSSSVWSSSEWPMEPSLSVLWLSLLTLLTWNRVRFSSPARFRSSTTSWSLRGTVEPPFRSDMAKTERVELVVKVAPIWS